MTRASDEMSTGPPSRSTKPRVVDVRSRIVATTTKRPSADSERHFPVVYASSAAVYGDSPDTRSREASILRPLSPYGADKLSNECHARAGAHVHGLASVGLRFFNVYGPRQRAGDPYSGVISTFRDRLARREPIVLHGDGGQSRDFVYVGDVVRALLLAIGCASA